MLLEKVKQLCKQDGITIAELERKLEFGNGTIHRWKGAQPALISVKLVANYFGVAIDDLANDELLTPSKASREIAEEFEKLSPSQKGLVKCYISLIKSSQEL